MQDEVYIVMRNVAYEFNHIMGIFRSKEGAERCADELIADHPNSEDDNITVENYKVD